MNLYASFLFKKASVGRRLGAFLIDHFIFSFALVFLFVFTLFAMQDNESFILLFIIFFFVIIFVGALVFGISSILKNHPSYHLATDYIRANPEIIEIIGEVEGFGFMPIGNLNTSLGRGDANYSISVKGTHGSVRVFVELQMRDGGDWEIIRFNFVQK